MKRYLLFAGRWGGQVGGWEDFIDSFDTVEDATKEGGGSFSSGRAKYDWYQVVDTQTWMVVADR